MAASERARQPAATLKYLTTTLGFPKCAPRPERFGR
jgi:hypothetical protein